jgi:hypothetical protein
VTAVADIVAGADDVLCLLQQVLVDVAAEEDFGFGVDGGVEVDVELGGSPHFGWGRVAFQLALPSATECRIMFGYLV